MSNEFSELALSRGVDVIFGEVVPNFDVLVNPVSTKEDSTVRCEKVENTKENGDDCDLVPPVNGDSTDQNMSSPNKGKAVVVQQKYGASM